MLPLLPIATATAAERLDRPGSPAVASQPRRAATKTLEGTIRKFECGDNCYLTIKTAKSEETGLCEAKACAPWFEKQKMPRSFVGKKVRVTTGTGVQRDGSGKTMGKTTSFKTLDFVK